MILIFFFISLSPVFGALEPTITKYISDEGSDINNNCSDNLTPCLTFFNALINQSSTPLKLVVEDNVTLHEKIALSNLVLSNGSLSSALVVEVRSREQESPYILFSVKPVLVENLVIFYPSDAGKIFLLADVDDPEGLSFLNVEFRNSENVRNTSYVLLIVSHGNLLFSNSSFINFVRAEDDNIVYPYGGVITGFPGGNFTVHSTLFTNCGHISTHGHGGAIFLFVYSSDFLSFTGGSTFHNVSAGGRGAAIFLDLSRINASDSTSAFTSVVASAFSPDSVGELNFNPFFFDSTIRFIECTSGALSSPSRVRDSGVFLYTNAYHDLLSVSSSGLGDGRIELNCKSSVWGATTYVVADAKVYDYETDTLKSPESGSGYRENDGVYDVLSAYIKSNCPDLMVEIKKGKPPSAAVVYSVLGVVLAVGLAFLIVFVIIEVARSRGARRTVREREIANTFTYETEVETLYGQSGGHRHVGKKAYFTYVNE